MVSAMLKTLSKDIMTSARWVSDILGGISWRTSNSNEGSPSEETLAEIDEGGEGGNECEERFSGRW